MVEVLVIVAPDDFNSRILSECLLDFFLCKISLMAIHNHHDVNVQFVFFHPLEAL